MERQQARVPPALAPQARAALALRRVQVARSSGQLPFRSPDAALREAPGAPEAA
jgi:hypothetical protein